MIERLNELNNYFPHFDRERSGRAVQNISEEGSVLSEEKNQVYQQLLACHD